MLLFNLIFLVPDYPDELYYVEVPVISNEECEDDYGANQITENMICAGDKVSTDSCQVSSSYVYNLVLSGYTKIRKLRSKLSYSGVSPKDFIQ